MLVVRLMSVVITAQDFVEFLKEYPWQLTPLPALRFHSGEVVPVTVCSRVLYDFSWRDCQVFMPLMDRCDELNKELFYLLDDDQLECTSLPTITFPHRDAV